MAKKTKDLSQERFLLARFSAATRTPREEALEEVRKFVERCMNPQASMQTILDEAVRTILKITEFTEIAIATRDADGNYRYKALSGFREEAEKARRAIVYTPADLKDYSTFPALRIGRVSQYHISERNPFKPGEEASFNKPDLLGVPRKNPDDMIEGDYIDIYISGLDNQFIAWLELSGTKSGKLPPREAIILTEILSSSLAAILLNLPDGERA
jgi:hypothetical protein